MRDGLASYSYKCRIIGVLQVAASEDFQRKPGPWLALAALVRLAANNFSRIIPAK